MAGRVSWSGGLGPVPERVPPEGYAYRCEDDGILKPWLYRLFVNPLARVLPASIAPNDITILATFASTAPLWVFFLLADAPRWVLAVVPALGLFCYVVLDHLDGTHARKTGRSSPLGELLDHWFDAWNGGLVCTAVNLAWGSSATVLTLNAALGALAYALAISEQRATGVLKLDKMGGNEGMMLISGTYALLALFPTSAQAQQLPLMAGVTLGPFLMFLCGFGTAGTCKNVFVRAGLRATLPDCLPIVLAGALSVAWAWAGLDGRVAAWIVSTAGAICAGRLVLARTTGVDPRWDGPGLVALFLGTAWTVVARPDPRSISLAGLAVLALHLLRGLADLAWGLDVLARYVRKGEVLALFVSPSEAARPTVGEP